MKIIIQNALIAVVLLLMPHVHFGQAPDLGTASSFAVFTSAGAFDNVGNTNITGNIGTDSGPLTGFPPGVVIGQIHTANAVTMQAAADLGGAYGQLAGTNCGAVLGVGLGNNQILTPNVYCTGGASTLTGNLTLDGQGNPNAIFIFKIDGAFSSSTSSSISLINGASLCNVFWQINGAFSLSQNSSFVGTALISGAISLAGGASIQGRALSTAGAVSLDNNSVFIGSVPTASVISASGSTTFCLGGMVVLSGNNGGIWSTGASTPSITVTTSGDYYVTNTNSCGSVLSNHIIVTVNPLPSCTVSGVNTVCQGQSTELCANTSGPVTYLWSTGATTSCITVNTGGTYGLTVTDVNNCSSTCSQTVTVNPSPVCAITGGNAICQGQSTQLCTTPLPGATYLWSNGATTNCITVNTGGTYFLTLTDANGCSSVCSQTLAVNPLPVCAITGGNAICLGQSTQLCTTPILGTTYLWSNGATTNCITVNTGGVYSLTLTDANGCSSVCSQTVTANPLPLCIITGNLSICLGQSTQLCTVSLPGATYLWSTGATTNCITVNTGGVYSLTLTDANGCSSVCSQTVILNPLPVCLILGSNFLCQAGQSTELCATIVPGATYLWNTGATTNCITVNAAGTYFLTVTAANGCSSICSQTVTLNPLPMCVITGGNSICMEQPIQLCTSPSSTATYLWSTGATTNCITVNTAGTYFLTVTEANGCSSICSQTVTLNPLPVCTITGGNAICLGQSTQLCTTPLPGATYLWNTGATTNCITVNTGGTYFLTLTDANGCSSVCSQTVSVNPLPVCAITGNLSICQGQSTQLCTLPLPGATYQWSTGATTNCITVNAGGTYFLTVTQVNGCSSTCSQIVTANPLPICAITGGNAICLGQSTQLCSTALPGATYLWSTGATTNCITVNTAGTYFLTVTAANGCSSTCSQTVSANPLPVCAITGNLSICQGQSTQLCTLPLPGATYQWSTGATTNCITVNTGGTYFLTVTDANGCSSTCSQIVTLNPLPVCLILGGNSICQAGQSIQLCTSPSGTATYLWSTGATTNCITVNAAGTYFLTVTEANGCSSTCSKTITVNPLPVCAITGGNAICLGQSTQLCTTPVPGATYQWSTGATTNCITVNTAGTYFLTVTDANGCSSVCNQTVAVNPLPLCVITGGNAICQGQSTQLCTSPVPGATYLWSNGATTNCITVNAAGTYFLTVTASNGCSSVCSQTVTINPLPNCAISGSSVICPGQSTQLCALAPPNATYLWSTGATVNCIIVSAAGTYTITITDPNGCSSTCSKTVSVNPLPICTITGGNSICQGQSTQLCATPIPGTTYQWSTGATANCITVSAAGTYFLTATDANGCSSVCNQSVTANPLPLCTITGDNAICQGQSTQLCTTPLPGATYLWSTGATSNCITVNAAGTYFLTVTASNGCSSVCSQTVTINPLPNCAISGSSVICPGQSTNLCSVAPSGSTYLWNTGATANCIMVSVAGTYTITITDPNGCSSSCSKTVSVGPLPNCTISGGESLCLGQLTQLCTPSLPGATYLWNTGATTNCITVGTAGTYSLTVTEENGCSSTCSKTVVVNPTPACTISGNTTICLGSSTQLCTPVVSTATYLWSTGATSNCITVNAAGTYFLTVTEANGCSSTCSKTVTVNPVPNCAISGSSVICPGQSTNLCSVAPSGSTYLWNTGATANCIIVSAAGTYTITITDPNGCSSTCSKTVSVSPSPICTITGGESICLGQSTQLCTIVPASSSFLWSTGATTNCITVNAAGTYFLTVTESNGCSSTCSKTVTVTPPPACTISGNTIICLGSSTQLCTPALSTATYLWSTGATNNCITVNAAGTYSLTVTDVNGCSSICSKTVTVGPLPVCTITGSDVICLGQSTQLCTAISTGATYLWSTGATTNCITVNTAGSYSLTVTEANGCSSICSKTVTVGPSPACIITGGNLTCLPGQSTQLCTALLPGATYLWNTGATTNCITVNTAGTYSLTVTEVNGCSSTCSQTVAFGPLPHCIISGNTAICEGQPTLLCAPAGYATYLWSTGATTSCIVVSTAGIYGLTVTATSGCSSTCSQVVTFGQVLPCTITGSCDLCYGQSTVLCAPDGYSSYWWSTGATTKCINVSTAGIYGLTVTNSSGCSSICSRTVTIGAVQTCYISGNCDLCVGQSTVLCAPADCASYWWSTGATTRCINVSTPGVYGLTITDANGCRSICSRIVTIGGTQQCDITGNCSLCSGQSTVLCAPADCASYWWSTGAMTRCITVNTPGNYCVTVTYANGCSSVCSRIVTGGPLLNCNISGNCDLLQGQSSQLCVPTGYASYLWTTGATTNCITVNTSGNYCVTITDVNGCSSVCSTIVTVGSSSNCHITGNGVVYQGQSTQFCAPFGAAAYLWSTGATSTCIAVSTAGTYGLTITNAAGQTSTCSKILVVSPAPNCEIYGNNTICHDQATLLCAPSGAATYLWSTGATTSCIIASAAGTYGVTIRDVSGYSSTGSKTLTLSPASTCFISGDASITPGHSTLLCAPAVAATFLWSTGATTSCIIVSTAGLYSLTLTDANGCSSTCTKTVRMMVVDGSIEVNAYPNPFSDQTTIEFKNTTSSSHVVIEVYSITGNKIKTLFDDDVKQDILYKAELNADNLNDGIYIYRVVNGNQIINRKLILNR